MEKWKMEWKQLLWSSAIALALALSSVSGAIDPVTAQQLANDHAQINTARAQLWTDRENAGLQAAARWSAAGDPVPYAFAWPPVGWRHRLARFELNHPFAPVGVSVRVGVRY